MVQKNLVSRVLYILSCKETICQYWPSPPSEFDLFIYLTQDKSKKKRSSFFALCVRRSSDDNLYNGYNKPIHVNAGGPRSITMPALKPFTVNRPQIPLAVERQLKVIRKIDYFLVVALKNKIIEKLK